MLNSEPLLASSTRINRSDGGARFENEKPPEKKESDSVNRAALSAAPLHLRPSTVNSTSSSISDTQLEVRALHERLNRLIQQESLLRKKLRGVQNKTPTSGPRENLRDNSELAPSDQDKATASPALYSKSVGEKVSAVSGGDSQRLLDQLLSEKRFLQSRLDKLSGGRLDAAKNLPSRGKPARPIVERDINIRKQGVDTKESPSALTQRTAQELGSDGASSDAFNGVIRKQARAGQLQSSVDNLLSSRQSLIDQYDNHKDLSALLSALDKQDSYMEAVLAAVSPTSSSADVQLKGAQVNIVV
ncbi:MAG: hypothetical protein KUG76_07155 [Gammaproteobacteria bacterium]|nr:hypothetical protein [Gammaproteobacteria bacterium]